MPSTVVHAALAVLVVAGLLGAYYDWRALGVVLAVLLAAEVDTVAGWYLPGAHRALLHNLLLPAGAAAVLYWDTCRRESSWLRARLDDRGVHVLWVALLAHVFAHVLLDMAHMDGVNPLYPLWNRFVRIEGEAYLSTAEGFVQTFVELGSDPETGATSLDVGQGGTTADTHVANPAQPTRDPPPDEPVDRRFPVVVAGWQLFLTAAGAFVLAARRLQSPLPEAAEDE